MRATETQILVSSIGKNLTAKRLAACAQLWEAGIKAETLYLENIKMDRTFKHAFDNGIPLILIIGEQEIQEGIYKVRVLNENKEYSFPVNELLPRVQELIKANPVLLSKDQLKTSNEEEKSNTG